MSAESIKKVNLEQIQKPKTLIVLHYKGKRISIPLHYSVENITEYLYNQLKKFEATVLEKENKTSQGPSLNSIVCFSSHESDKNKMDIKMNILLSFSRLSKDFDRARGDLLELDISNYYKYIEIEPYYGFTSSELIPEYQLFSVLSQGSYYTSYLGRRICDGRFFTVKIVRSDYKLGYNEYITMRSMYQKQSHFQNKKELELIPQIEEIRKGEGVYILIYEYCPGGPLKNYLTHKLSEIECLHYMKQLVWGIHILHKEFNLIHRALCCENVEVDFVGNLRLTNFSYCQNCYSEFGGNSIMAESYEESYQIENVNTPPEVQRSSSYNNLVDYYGVGSILCQIYNEFSEYSCSEDDSSYGEHHNHRDHVQKQGIQSVIENLMEENIKYRKEYVDELVHELAIEKESRKKEGKIGCLEYERLGVGQIWTGEPIKIDEKVKNGIRHEDAIKMMRPSCDDQFYYLNPIKNRKKDKSRSKDKTTSKKKSKSKEKPLETPKGFSTKTHGSKQSNLPGKNSSLTRSDKSLNKSIDSSKHSATSKESRKSQKSKNSQVSKVKSQSGKTTMVLTAIPKSPKNVRPGILSPKRNEVKSPNKGMYK